MILDPSQEQAVMRTINTRKKVSIITGPAGTGKTTVIRNLAAAWTGRCILCAPTGKAAARIREACGLGAATIHRELLWDGDQIRRKEPFSMPVIVDEASMLDSWLLARLMEFKPPKLVLVGDADQLAPVGRGQPFHDMVNSGGTVELNELTVNHRAKEAIHDAATDIRAGRIPPSDLRTAEEMWMHCETGPADLTTETLIEWVKSGQYDPEQDIVLSPRYGSEEENDGGIDALNKAIRAVVNPPLTDAKFQEGDRLLVCKNFGSEDLWNGDTGTIVGIDMDGRPLARLDRDLSNPRALSPEQSRECRHGYALSVHKAQGSQFRRVFFVCLRSHWHMLSRSLVYTAITRARKGCVVLGEFSAFVHGIETVASKKTVLQSLIHSAA